MADQTSRPDLHYEDFVITANFTPEDYKEKWGHQICYVKDHGERERIFNKVYDHIEDLLFGGHSNEETQAKAIAFLEVVRPDAAFFNPYIYNDWIGTVKEEITERKMFEFWQREIVAKKLGLISAMDSDLFDDMDDPEPAEFYKLQETDPDIVCSTEYNQQIGQMADQESRPKLKYEDFEITANFTPDDYDEKWSRQICDVEDHEDRERIFNKLYKHIWNLLFEAQSNEETQAKAIAFLKVVRPDAAYFNPFLYNDWIRTVKEEIIKHKMFEFWQQEVVPKRLGLIWARDSDYFDDMDDPEPAQFYKLRDTDPDIVWDT